MKKFISMVLIAAMTISLGTPIKAASMQELKDGVKTMVVDMSEVGVSAVTMATVPTATRVMSKDFASSTKGQTGTIYSIGQIVDFSRVIPAGSRIQDVTVYCPSNTKVTQSKFTTISKYVITNNSTGTSATVSFQKTDRPSSNSKTSAFSGEEGNVKFLVQIQGRILQQYTGMDGFTVFGGKMIITYR